MHFYMAMQSHKANVVYYYSQLASSGLYGPLLARSGYERQDAPYYNNPMVMICENVYALPLL